MNADRLLAHYDRIADAPDAIPRLRCFILDLAVRGKLVPQDLRDEPASTLLKRFMGTRQIRENDSNVRKVQSETVDETPVLLPSNWVWIRLGLIGEWGSGSRRSCK